jgi:hypothetical protein
MSMMRTFADPFLQRIAMPHTSVLNVLGLPIKFESNACWLLELAQEAFAGLPAVDPSSQASDVSASVRMIANDDLPSHAFDAPPPPLTYGDNHACMLALSRADASIVNLSAGCALITVSPALARFPYHVRYELIEFAAYRLAAHLLGAIGMHAACVARGDASLMLLGESGAGKSTLVLALMQQGWELIAEDGLFVLPHIPCALRGAPNFIHLTDDAQHVVNMANVTGNLIQRRSGRTKLEIDARTLRTAPRVEAPLGSLIFIEADGADETPLLAPMDRVCAQQMLNTLQPFAARHARWPAVLETLLAQPAYRLRRGNLRDMVALLSQLGHGVV